MTGNLSFAAGAVIGHSKIKTGTYVGNGVNNRQLNIGINLAAKTNVYIIIKGVEGPQLALHRTEYGQGDVTMFYAATADTTDAIQALTATGFELGTRGDVNFNTYTYRYIVIYDET